LSFEPIAYAYNVPVLSFQKGTSEDKTRVKEEDCQNGSGQDFDQQPEADRANRG
jgi:hypothetical protein